MLATVTPTIDYQPVSENHGHFVVEPLEPGYGLTLGNAMRRVLLSSLPGAAITTVKIDGAQHEFTTIPHVKEDIMEFLLNVKGIRIRCLSDRADTLRLEASGEGEIKAGDIKESAIFEIVNPEHHLATLDKAKAQLNVEFTVEIGKGYVTAGSNEGLPIGVLPTDAVFTPIRRVNYEVTKTRVEDRSDYDRLILDVWTDGTLSPESAVAESARILSLQLDTFINLGKPGEIPSLAEEEANAPSEHFEISLEQLGLSSRTINALRRGGVSTTEALLEKNKDELVGLKNFGIKSWKEVQDRLIKAGIVKSDEESEEAESAEVPEEEKSAEELEREEMLKRLGERFTVRGEK